MTTPHKLAVAAAVAGTAAAVAGVLLPAAPAQAAAATTGRQVPAALCVHAAPGIRHGVGECIQTTHHGHRELVWLGSYRASNGQVFYCIDTDYSGRVTRYNLGTLADVRNQNGTPIPAHTAQLLSYLVTTHGDTTNPRVAAGMQALIRAGMDDTAGRFGHLAGDHYSAPGWMPAVDAAAAQQLLMEAATHIGGYRVSVTGVPEVIEPGASYTAVVRVVSAAGKPMAGKPVTIHLAGLGTSDSLRGLRTDANGSVRVRVATRGNPTSARIDATVAGLPAAAARLEVPQGWRTHARHTRVAQRGIIPTVGVTSASASLQVAVYRPGITTQASHHLLVAGDTQTDTALPHGVLGRDAAGTPITNQVTGVYLAARPARDTDCTSVDWHHAKVLQRFTVPGSISTDRPLPGIGAHKVTAAETGMCETYQETITSTVGGRTITSTTPAGQPSETAYVARKVQFMVEDDTWHLTNAAALSNARQIMADGRFTYGEDIVHHRGRVTHPLWARGVHISSVETPATITVPASWTPAQVLAAEKAQVAASIGAKAGAVQVPAHVGDTARIAWLILAPGTDGNRFGSWHKGTTRAQGPHTLPQLLAASKVTR